MPSLVTINLDRTDARIAGLLLRRVSEELDHVPHPTELDAKQRGNRRWYAERARAVSADLLKVGSRFDNGEDPFRA